MSMLARFRKPGGVQQLVVLLESCLLKKREALIKTIETEDKEFAAMVKAKVLTVERIFKWDPLVISEATSKMGDRTLAIALKGLGPEAVGIALHTFRDLRKRDITNLLENVKPSPVEIESAHIKLVEIVRTLEKDGSLKLDANDLPVGAATSTASTAAGAARKAA